MIIGRLYMKFFDENYSQEIPTRIKCLRKKYNLKQSDLGNADQASQVEKEEFERICIFYFLFHLCPMLLE